MPGKWSTEAFDDTGPHRSNCGSCIACARRPGRRPACPAPRLGAGSLLSGRLGGRAATFTWIASVAHATNYGGMNASNITEFSKISSKDRVLTTHHQRKIAGYGKYHMFLGKLKLAALRSCFCAGLPPPTAGWREVIMRWSRAKQERLLSQNIAISKAW